MGCQFNFARLKASADNAARDEAQELISQAAWEHGNGGYSGSFAEAPGCELRTNKIFDSAAEAEAWLDEHAKKWGPALIVKTKDNKYFVGANCSS